MGYVRYKLPDETHEILKRVCKRLGMKESEMSRMALMDYLRSLSVLSEKVKKMQIIRR
jgi:antitoxin component of RelBE/YafQ-DinJ toxin-antitoxin module